MDLKKKKVLQGVHRWIGYDVRVSSGRREEEEEEEEGVTGLQGPEGPEGCYTGYASDYVAN
jgi:hypothetical protein